MLHVGMGADAGGLRSFGESKGIRTFAYGALGEPGPSEELLSNPTLRKIGKAHGGRSPEEVALRWVLQTGAACSVRTPDRESIGATLTPRLIIEVTTQTGLNGCSRPLLTS